jgi:hypothetical protein
MHQIFEVALSKKMLNTKILLTSMKTCTYEF